MISAAAAGPSPTAEDVARALAESGRTVADGFLDAGEARALAEECARLWRRGAFRHARVGRGSSLRLQPEVRSDHLLWLTAPGETRRQRRFFERMESLRQALNRELYLGLFGFEAHLAVYPAGARYRTHLDRFTHARHRLVSAIVYLNPEWDESDGGALRLYLGEPDVAPFEDVAPLGGRLACFLSDRFHHEVLPARRERLSLTGWFTQRE